MPELPEVETVKRTLTGAIGRRCTGVWTSGLPLRLNRPVDESALVRAARGKTLEQVRRHGKYLLLEFGDRRPHSVIVHLGMTGRLRLVRRNTPPAPHTHVIFRLAARAGDDRELRYSDPRRFGLISTVERGREPEHPSLAVLGVDPLAGDIDPVWLHGRARRTKRTIKALLLDQGIIAGVGNIYASEALWEAGIRPTTRAHKVSRARCQALALAVQSVLDRALTHGGTSLRDFVDADGKQGDNSSYLRVYDREGEACPRSGCGGQIRRSVQEGRATFFCGRCQH